MDVFNRLPALAAFAGLAALTLAVPAAHGLPPDRSVHGGWGWQGGAGGTGGGWSWRGGSSGYWNGNVFIVAPWAYHTYYRLYPYYSNVSHGYETLDEYLYFCSLPRVYYDPADCDGE